MQNFLVRMLKRKINERKEGEEGAGGESQKLSPSFFQFKTVNRESQTGPRDFEQIFAVGRDGVQP